MPSKEIREILERSSISTESFSELSWSPDGRFYSFETDKQYALGAWEQLRSLYSSTKYWPVIVLGEKLIQFEWFERQIKDFKSAQSKLSEFHHTQRCRSAEMLKQQIEDLEKQMYEADKCLVETPEANRLLKLLFPPLADFIEDPVKQPREIYQATINASIHGFKQVLRAFPESFKPFSAEEAISEGEKFNFQDWVAYKLEDSPLIQAMESAPKSVQTPPSAFRHSINDDLQQCTLLLIKADESWHVPAYLNYGHSNAPKSAVHVGALRSWNERYGAELVELSFDSLTLLVPKAIENFDDASNLATEHFAYCKDSVLKADGSLKGLAQRIQHANIWQFWWNL